LLGPGRGEGGVQLPSVQEDLPIPACPGEEHHAGRGDAFTLATVCHSKRYDSDSGAQKSNAMAPPRGLTLEFL